MHVETKHNHQRFPCTHPGCTLDFSTDCNRRTHIQAQHQGRRTHCDYPGCTASYCSAALLRKHVQSVHQSLKRHTCAKCSMSYARKSSLTRHEKVYHQHYRLHCKWPGCKKTFTASDKLYAHVRAQHKARARHKTPDSEAPVPETQVQIQSLAKSASALNTSRICAKPQCHDAPVHASSILASLFNTASFYHVFCIQVVISQHITSVIVVFS